jgi:predicted nucleic acid-binding protein
MLLYLDTSALVKLFIEERYSGRVREWVDAVDVVLTCRVAYAEAVAAFSRRHREGDLRQADYRGVMQAFDKQWESFGRLEFNERAAAQLAAKHALRGFDAIHLSAARMLMSDAGGTSVAFSSFDDRLNRAAEKENMTVLHP